MLNFTRCATACRVAAACALLPSYVFAETQQPDNGTDDLTIERISVHGHRAPLVDTMEQTIAPQIAPDVRDQLDIEPGIAINSNGPITAILQHRGMFGDRLHVSHEGGSLFGAGPNAMDSPLSHVISIESPVATIYRGIAPVSAGYESIGGVVKFDAQAWDLSSRDALQYRGHAIADYSDNGDRQQYGAFAEVVGQHWGLRSALQIQLGDDYQDGNGTAVLNTEYERRMGSLATIWQDGEHSVDFSLSHNRTDTAGTPSLAMDIEFIDATWYRLGYQFEGEQQSFGLRLYGNNNRHDMSNFVLRQRMPAMQRRNDVSSDVLGITATYQLALSRGIHQLDANLGGEFVQRDHESRITNPSNDMFFINNFVDVERDIQTVYAELNWRHQGLFATLGIRPTRVAMDAAEVSTNMAMMNPNVAMLVTQFNAAERSQTRNWVDASIQFGRELSRSVRVYANIAQKGRAPSYHELYTWFPLGISAGLADGRNYIGSVQLNHELASQVEVAVDVEYGSWSVSPRVFWYDIEDYIIGRPSQSMPANMISNMMAGQAPLQWSNTDARIWGADIALGWQVTDAWRLEAIMEWVRGEDTRANDDLYRLAPQRADLRLGYQADQWLAYLAAELVAEQDRVFGIQNEQPTAGYGIVSAGVDVQLTEHWRLQGSIENLFDKFYRTHLSGVNRVSSETLAVGERIPELGRSLHISVAYTF